MIIELTADEGEKWVGDIEIIVRNGEISNTDAVFTCNGSEVDEEDVPDEIYNSIMDEAEKRTVGLKSQRQIDLEENGRWG